MYVGTKVALVPKPATSPATLGDASTPAFSFTTAQLGWTIAAIAGGLFAIGLVTQPTLAKSTRRARRRAQEVAGSPVWTNLAVAVGSSVITATVLDVLRRQQQ